MKKLIFTLLLVNLYIYANGQSYTDQERAKYGRMSEDERITLLHKESGYKNQVFNTDSVYSFFESNPFKPLVDRNIMFTVEDEPIPYHTIIKEAEKNYFLYTLGYPLPNHLRKKELNVIPTNKLYKMLGAALDSTTQYSQPIVKWNAARLGQKWITRSNKSYLLSLIDNRMKNKDKKNYEKHLADPFHRACSFEFIKMSIPVFDDEYKYAFLIFDLGEYYSFALFKRNGLEWDPIQVTRGERCFLIDSNFTNY